LQQDELAGLLRFESSLTPEGTISLDTYVERMKPKQEEIYYLHVPNRRMGETSPYFESFKRKGIEVLFVYVMTDEVVMQNIVDYSSKRVTSIESANIDLSQFEDDAAFKKDPEQENKDSDSKISTEELAKFCSWVKDVALSGKVHTNKKKCVFVFFLFV
jgi:TNF receptor-associated protein 1